ncbi:hypothetical protein KRMM14A1259_51060 [Krasilnikovia sp. MM14-A1259]
MQATRWLRLGFFAAAGLQVTALFLDYRLAPYCGSFAMAALLAMGVADLVQLGPLGLASPGPRRWTRHAALAGLALLTLTAFLVDRRTGGYGWPAEFATGLGYDWADMTEPALLTTGAAALAAAVLGRAGSLLRWRHVPAALLAVVFVLLIAAHVADPAVHPVKLDPWTRPPDLAPRLLTLVPAAIVVAALGLAANAVLLAGGVRRQACAGIFAIMTLTMAGLNYMEDNHVMEPEFDFAVWQTYHPAEAAELRMPIRLSPAFLPPGPTPEDVKAVPSRGFFGVGPGILVAPAPEEKSDITAVPGPPSWTLNPWEGDTDWARAFPALGATLLLAGLVALVTALFPTRQHRLDS